MNRWLVGVGAFGAIITIICYFIPWIIMETVTQNEFFHEISSIHLSGRSLVSSYTVLMGGVLALFGVLVATICPVERKFALVPKIIGVLLIMCGVLILIGVMGAFSDAQALAGLTTMPPFVITTIDIDYGFILSALGGVLVLLAGIFGMVD